MVEALTKNSEAYCQQMVIEARTRQLANQIAQDEQDINNIKYNEDGSAKMYSKKNKVKQETVQVGTNSAGGAIYSEKNVEIANSSDWDEANRQIAAKRKAIQRNRQLLEEEVKKASSIDMKVKGSKTPPTVIDPGPNTPKTSPSKKDGNAEKEQETIIENAKSYQDLAHNVRLYDQQLKAIDPQQTAEVERLKQLKTEAEQQMEAVEGLITTKREEKKATEEVVPAHISQLNTMEELNNAISYYNEKQQKAQASEVAGLQATINQLERKKAAMEGIANLTNIREQTTKLDGMGDQQLKMELELIGLEGVKERIRQLQNMLDDTENPLDESQRKEVKKLMASWQDYEAELQRSQVTFQGTWSSIKGVGSGVESITQALEGNGNAWQTITGLVDGAIAVYEGVSAISGIIDLLTASSVAHTAVKGVEAASEVTHAGTLAAEATATTAASTTAIVANKLEAASWKELAAAKYMAAHAYIPFAGFSIAMGFVTSMMAAVAAAGIPALASGGLAYGPTLALVGEYGGASGNPEVIAPLDKLRGLIGGGTPAETEVRFRIRGRELVGLLEKEYNLKNRT